RGRARLYPISTLRRIGPDPPLPERWTRRTPPPAGTPAGESPQRTGEVSSGTCDERAPARGRVVRPIVDPVSPDRRGGARHRPRRFRLPVLPGPVRPCRA